MSHEIDYDNVYAVYREKAVVARKPHKCSACCEDIIKGHTYTYIFIVFDGDNSSLRRCVRCQTLHEHLRERGESRGTWPSEKLNCGESYEEAWGDVPAEIERLAFATAEEMQAIGGTK